MPKAVGSESTQGEAARSLLDEIAREGARRMLAALEIEVAAYLESSTDSGMSRSLLN